MCKPIGQETIRTDKPVTIEIHAPAEQDAVLREERQLQQVVQQPQEVQRLQQPREVQAVQEQAEPRFAQPEQVQEAAPAPEMMEPPVQQQELGWKDRQVARWNAYQARKQAEKQEKQARKQEAERKKRRAAADRWLEKSADYVWENVPEARYDVNFEQLTRMHKIRRLSNMEHYAPILLKETDARPFLKELRSAKELYLYLLSESRKLQFMQESVIPVMREKEKPASQDALDRLDERRGKMDVDMESIRQHCERLENRFRELIPEEKQAAARNLDLDDPLYVSMREKEVLQYRDRRWREHQEELTVGQAAERLAEEAIRANRIPTLQNLEECRRRHLEEVVLPGEFAPAQRRAVGETGDLAGTRAELRESYAADLERNRQTHFEQMLEKLDQLPTPKAQRDLLEQELRSIGYVGLDDQMTGRLQAIWDGKAVMRSGGGVNNWHVALNQMKTALVAADRQYRQAHPELNRLPEELQQAPDQELWRKADAVVGAYIREAMRDASYQLRVPNCAVLQAILNDGRFKTQLETNSSRGDLFAQNRKDFTRISFGVDSSQMDPADFEIYGYASHGDLVRESTAESRVGSWVSQYGQVVVKLKKDRMQDRTTMLVGDSMNTFARTRVGWVDKPDLQAVGNRYEAIVAAYKHQYRMQSGVDDPVDLERMLREIDASYAELQFHGGVRLEDIESVTLLTTMHTPDGPMEGLEQDFPDALLAQLKENGIQVRIVREGKENEC